MKPVEVQQNKPNNKANKSSACGEHRFKDFALAKYYS